MKKILLAVAILLGIATPVFAQEAPIFIRYQKGKTAQDGALQIAQAVYESPKTKVKVVMYGVVHVADKAYYQAVQKDLDSYDAVLYEGVGTPAEKKAMEGKKKPTSSISELQMLMCDVLGLEYQLKAINYKAKNLVHADMSIKQFQQATGGQGVPQPGIPGMDFLNNESMKPLLKMGKQLIKMLMKSNPQWQNSLKLQMAQQLTQAAGGKVPGMSEQMYNVIVIERNKVVMKVLEKELAKRKKGTIAVFYGAAHMPDFHKRMEKLGFKQTSKTWKSAWSLGTGGAQGNPQPQEQPKQKVKPAPKGSKWF